MIKLDQAKSKKESKAMDNDYVFMLEIERMKKDIDEINNTKLPVLEGKIDKIEKKFEKVDSRLWMIIMLIVSSIAIPILLEYFTK